MRKHKNVCLIRKDDSMKRKQVIFTLCFTLALCCSVLIYKLISDNKDDGFKGIVTKASKIVSNTGKEKNKSEGKSNAVGSKALFKTANKEGNTQGNLINYGLISQQDKRLYFAYDGLYMSFMDMSTGWKRISEDVPTNINIIGEWIYYINGKAELCKIKADGSGRTVLSDKAIIFFLVRGDNIYYTAGVKINLYKMKTDGSKNVKLVDGNCRVFNLEGDWIYYTDRIDTTNINTLWKIKTDGTSKEKIIESCNTPIISGQWIYYLDYYNNLYKAKFDGTSKTKVSDSDIFTFNVEGNYIYYLERNIVKNNRCLYKIKLDGTEKMKIEEIDNEKKLYINITSENIIVGSLDGKSVYKYKK